MLNKVSHFVLGVLLIAVLVSSIMTAVYLFVQMF
jgi:hypothetical protein